MVHRAAQQGVALGVEGRDAGVRFVRGAIDLLRLTLFVVAELLPHLETPHRAAGLVQQREGVPFGNRRRRRVVDRQRDRHGPGRAVGEVHFIDHARVVGARHEAGQRGVGTDTQQLDIVQLPLAEAHGRRRGDGRHRTAPAAAAVRSTGLASMGVTCPLPQARYPCRSSAARIFRSDACGVSLAVFTATSGCSGAS